MAAIEIQERDSFKAGLVSGCGARGCGVCPVAACPLRGPQTGEFGKEAKVWVVGSTTELFSKKSPRLRDGIFYFDPARGGSGEPPIRTTEKTCSECKKPASACSHSETSKR